MLLQSEVVGIGRRLFGTALDLVVLNLINIPFASTMRDYSYSALTIFVINFALMLIYSALMLVARGQTLGHLILGLRVISEDEGGIDPKQALLRSAVKWTPVFGVFILQAIIDPTPVQLLAIQDGSAPVAEDGNLISEALFLLGFVCWIVLIVMARRHPDGQGWHDRLAKTFVIRTPS